MNGTATDRVVVLDTETGASICCHDDGGQTITCPSCANPATGLPLAIRLSPAASRVAFDVYCRHLSSRHGIAV